jgi:preprotein translocase subunit Sec63
VKEEQQKEPDLWLIKAGFVVPKEVAVTSKAKRVASLTLLEDCSKQTKLNNQQQVVQEEDDRQWGVRAEGAHSPKEAQAEGA